MKQCPWAPELGVGFLHAGPRGAGEIHLLGFLEDVLKLGLPPTKKETEFESTSWEFLNKQFKAPVKKILTVKMRQDGPAKQK